MKVCIVFFSFDCVYEGVEEKIMKNKLQAESVIYTFGGDNFFLL